MSIYSTVQLCSITSLRHSGQHLYRAIGRLQVRITLGFWLFEKGAHYEVDYSGKKNLLSWTAMHIDFVMCKKEKNLICDENWNCLDRKNATSSRKCKALRVAATKAMQTAEFKNYCRETLGIAPNYFIAQECAKVTGSISEAAVSTQILSK